MDHHSYDGHFESDQGVSLLSDDLDAISQFAFFGDSGLDGLWPDDWTTTTHNEEFIISASSSAPQLGSFESQGLTSDPPAPPASAGEPKAKRKQRKEKKVQARKVQASPTREGFLELQNTIPSIAAPIPPASLAQPAPGVTANDENEPADSGISVPLTSVNPSVFYCATQRDHVAQPDTSGPPKSRAAKGANDIGVPQPEVLPEQSSVPSETSTTEDLEAVLKNFYENYDSILATELEARREVQCQATDALSVPIIPNDPVACVTESASRKRKLGDDFEDDMAEAVELPEVVGPSEDAGLFSDLFSDPGDDTAEVTALPEVAESSEGAGICEGTEPSTITNSGDGDFSEAVESAWNVESLGHAAPTEVVGSLQTESQGNAEPSRNVNISGGVGAEPPRAAGHSEVTDSPEAVKPLENADGLEERYCDYCEIIFRKRHASQHYKNAGCRNNRFKYGFIHGVPPTWYTPLANLRAFHGCKDRPSQRPEDRCDDSCEERRKIWEEHVAKNPKKKIAKILEDLDDFHAPSPTIKAPDISKIAAGMSPEALKRFEEELAVTPRSRPKKVPRTGKKTAAVGASVATPELPHSPPASWAPMEQAGYSLQPYTMTAPTVAGGMGAHVCGGPVQVAYPVSARSYTLGNAIPGPSSYARLPFIQPPNQELGGPGPAAGPSSHAHYHYATPAVAARNAAPYYPPETYLPHPQHTIAHTMPMGRMQPSLPPNNASPAMGNGYYGAYDYVTTPIMAAPSLPVIPPPMGNGYYHAQPATATTPTMNVPPAPNADFSAAQFVWSTNQDYDQTYNES